jgi:lactam utilization protein B
MQMQHNLASSYFIDREMKTRDADGALYIRQLVGAAHASRSQGVGETRKSIKSHELTSFDAQQPT